MPEGCYWLQAGGLSSSHPASERVRACAGASGVVLRLRVGGSIAGRCVAPDGRGCDADLTLTLVDEDLAWTLRSGDDGRFEFDRQVAGRYTLVATTRSDLCAFMTGVELAEGQALDGVELALAPGATLKLTYDGTKRGADFDVLVAGASFARGSLSRGHASTVLVPAGACELVWSDRGGARRTVPLTLESHETRETRWGGAP